MNQVSALLKFPSLIIYHLEGCRHQCQLPTGFAGGREVPLPVQKFCIRALRGLCFANVTQKSGKDSRRRPLHSVIHKGFMKVNDCSSADWSHRLHSMPAIINLSCARAQDCWVSHCMPAEVYVKPRKTSTNFNLKKSPQNRDQKVSAGYKGRKCIGLKFWRGERARALSFPALSKRMWHIYL